MSSGQVAPVLPGSSRSRERLRAPLLNALALVGVALFALFLGNALVSGATANAIAIVGILAVVMLLALSSSAGLLLWMALAPFGLLLNVSMGRGLPDLSLSRAAALFLLAVLVAQVAIGRRRLARLTAIEAWGAVFLLAMLLSVLPSDMGLVGGVQFVFDAVVMPLLVFYFARNLLRTTQHLRWTYLVMAVTVGIIGLIATREQLTNQPFLSPVPYRWEYGQHSVKVTSLFGAPAIMAATLALPVPFVVMGVLRAHRMAERLIGIAGLALAAAGLLFTYVRAGWLASTVGILVVVLFSRRGRAVALPLIAVLAVLALVLGGGLLDTRAIQERLQSVNPINYRMDAIGVGLEIAARSPLFGVGLNNFGSAALAAGWRPLNEMGTPVLAPHNLFLYVLTSAGLVGLAPLLFLLGSAGWRAVRVWRGGTSAGNDWGAVALAMLAGFLVLANTFDVLAAKVAIMYLFLLLGAIFANADREKDELEARQ